MYFLRMSVCALCLARAVLLHEAKGEECKCYLQFDGKSKASFEYCKRFMENEFILVLL